MKAIFLLSLFAATTLFGDIMTIDNQTTYPNAEQKSQIGVQWAASSDELNDKMVYDMYQTKVQADVMIQQAGKMQLTIPPQEKYFRILVWTKDSPVPTYNTSWVLIVPSKNYTLTQKDLYDTVLSSGSGC